VWHHFKLSALIGSFFRDPRSLLLQLLPSDKQMRELSRNSDVTVQVTSIYFRLAAHVSWGCKTHSDLAKSEAELSAHGQDGFSFLIIILPCTAYGAPLHYYLTSNKMLGLTLHRATYCYVPRPISVGGVRQKLSITSLFFHYISLHMS
jgi:hypothetical protein